MLLELKPEWGGVRLEPMCGSHSSPLPLSLDCVSWVYA